MISSFELLTPSSQSFSLVSIHFHVYAFADLPSSTILHRYVLATFLSYVLSSSSCFNMFGRPQSVPTNLWNFMVTHEIVFMF